MEGVCGFVECVGYGGGVGGEGVVCVCMCVRDGYKKGVVDRGGGGRAAGT